MSRRRKTTKLRKAAASHQNDLIVLAADRDIKETVDALLQSRCASLGIRAVNHETISHPQHDPGCLNGSVEILRLYQSSHRYALVIFDRDGCGHEDRDRDDLETQLENSLSRSGWGDRAKAIVIQPEIECWVWSKWPQLETYLGWKSEIPMRSWLVENNFMDDENQAKPEDPKGSMQAVLRFAEQPQSSAIFRRIAEQVPLGSCIDPSFVKFKEALAAWFRR